MTNDLDSFLESLTTEASTDAPFQLNEDASPTSKIDFISCRAKNFRSVGDWMEFNFISNRLTLVASDDNGSGKSTLCVWAPYFALFGKPYNKKEKVGALVNTQVGKDLLVELIFKTRGVTYKIVRGYKPKVDELYKLESDNWVKVEIKAGLYQEQLDDILKIDSSVVEKTMILGLDKYQPFVDLDAPSRRVLVERIWDLGVFASMLEEAKARRAVVKRDLQTLEASMNVNEAKVASAADALASAESFKQVIETNKAELATLEQQVSDLEKLIPEQEKNLATFEAELLSRKEQLQAEELQVKRQVATEHKEELVALQNKQAEADEKAQCLEHDATVQFEEESKHLNEQVESLKIKHQTELDEYYAFVRAEGEKLKVQLEQSKAEGDAAYEDVMSEEYVVPSDLRDELSESIDKIPSPEKIDELESTIEKITSGRDSAQKSAESERGVIRTLEYDLKQARAPLEEFKESERKLKETGACPHCFQDVGEESIRLFRQSVEAKIAEIEAESERIGEEITKRSGEATNYESLVEKANAKLEDLSGELALLHQQRIEAERIVGEVQAKISTAKAVWESEKRTRAEKASTELQVEAKKAQEEFISEHRHKPKEIASRHADELREPKSALETLNSKIEAAKAQARSEAAEINSGVTAAMNTFKERVNAVITERTSKIKAELETIESRLLEDVKTKQAEIDGNLDLLEREREERDNKKKANTEYSKKVEDLESKNRKILDETEALLKDEQTKHTELSDMERYLEYCIAELGDSAAKREIIKQYIPFLNGKINEYMAAMGLHVGFKMDEAFNIEFTSPDRKNQTIHSLSNGQKTRMNISILFAFRDIANMKNTTATNLLVLDEILEPISEQGIREVVEMLRLKFQDTNIVVISQRKQEFMEYFDKTITYTLKGGFTELNETE